MRRYQFRLERILEIRRYRELQQELRLAAATGECVRLQNELKGLDEAKRSTLANRYALSGGDMNYLIASELYMRRLDATARTDAKILQEKETIREAIRTEYLAASRDRKVLDRLKEKRMQAHYREELREETKLLDDISASAAARVATGA